MTKYRLSLSLLAMLTSFSVLSAGTDMGQATTTDPQTNKVSGQEIAKVKFSQAQIEQMLAPIALYPDTLLTHILIASTYPLEVIEADRFLKKHKEYSQQEISTLSEKKEWDPSVIALIPFPKIIANLSEDLTWMTNLGDAFLQDEQQVLASVQTLRQKAESAGNLDSMDNVNIVREKQTIIIEPAQPEVIYVPYYDTRVVYGHWHWPHYPPVYWHRPVHYSYYHGPYYWHSGVHIAATFFAIGFHWGNHHVVHHHHSYYNKRYYRHHGGHHHKKAKISTSYEAKRWKHNPHHRRGVAYRSYTVKEKYASARPASYQTKHIRKVDKQIYARNTAHKVNKSPYVSAQHKQVSKQLAVSKTKVKTNPNKYQGNHYNNNTRYKSDTYALKSSASRNNVAKNKAYKVNNHVSRNKSTHKKNVNKYQRAPSYEHGGTNYKNSSKNTNSTYSYNKPKSVNNSYKAKPSYNSGSKNYSHNKASTKKPSYSYKAPKPNNSYKAPKPSKNAASTKSYSKPSSNNRARTKERR